MAIGTRSRNANQLTYQAPAAGGTATLLYLVAVAAHLNQHNAQSLCFGHQALQEVGPAARVAAHGVVDAADVVVHGGPFVANGHEIAL